MEAFRRDQLNENLRRFGITMSDRMVQHAVAGVGIKPTYKGEAGGRGKTSWFDPVDTWVLATAEFGRDAAWTSEAVRLERVAGLYEYARSLEGAADIPGFLSDPGLGMKLLYIARWEGGFPIAKLFECLGNDPRLCELSSYEPSFLWKWLRSYQLALGAAWASKPLPSPETAEFVVPRDLEAEGRYFAAELIGWAAGMFRGAASSGGAAEQVNRV